MRDRVWNCVWKRELFGRKSEKENLEMLYFSIQMAAAELFTNETVFQLFWMIFSMGRIRISLWQFSGG